MSFLNRAKEVIDIEIDGLLSLKRNLDSNFDLAVNIILNSKGRVIIMGMGKSGLIGQKIAASMSSTGTPAYSIHPSEAYHGDLGIITKDDVLVLISNSGETEELLKLLSFFENNNNKIISITGNKESSLSKYSDVNLNAFVEKEACPLELAPTASTTATLALGDALVVCLMEAKKFKEESFARFHPGGSLGRKLLLKVSDLMKKDNLPQVSMFESFQNIVSAISEGMLGIVLVLDKGEIKGVISDGDIRRAFELKKEKVFFLESKDLMNPNPITINSNEKIIKAEDIFSQKKISAIVVKSNSNKVVGILHLYDL